MRIRPPLHSIHIVDHLPDEDDREKDWNGLIAMDEPLANEDEEEDLHRNAQSSLDVRHSPCSGPLVNGAAGDDARCGCPEEEAPTSS